MFSGSGVQKPLASGAGVATFACAVRRCPLRTPACASRRSDDPNDPDRLDARKLTRATLQTLIFGHIDALLPRCSVRLRCDDVGELG